MTSDQLLEELGTMLGRCVKVIRELETENEELKARREWKGLTVKERASIYDKYRRGEMVDSFEMMFAVEDKLKEKNHD